jgi:hypothetical protein
VRALTIHDPKAVEVGDLAAQFYLSEEDVGQNRAEACKERLQELNNAVEVAASAAELTPEFLGQFQVRSRRAGAHQLGVSAGRRLRVWSACVRACSNDTHKLLLLLLLPLGHFHRWWC